MSIVLKAGDTLPYFEATLVDATGSPLDLTGCTVRVVIAQRNRAPIVDAEVELLDAPAGRIRHKWDEGETDEPGRYSVEAEIEWSNGERQTVPSSGYGQVTIEPKLRDWP